MSQLSIEIKNTAPFERALKKKKIGFNIHTQRVLGYRVYEFGQSTNFYRARKIKNQLTKKKK